MSGIVMDSKNSPIALKSFETGTTLIASVNFAEGVDVAVVSGMRILDIPTMHTIQVDTDKHLDLGEDFVKFMDHSCEPNCTLIIKQSQDVSTGFILHMRTLRPIAKGERFSFNYNSTEWDMTSPFDCICGTPKCVQRVKGYKHLPNEVKEYLTPITSPVIVAIHKRQVAV